MLSRVASIFKKSIVHAKISGKITNETTKQLTKEFKRINFRTPKLIAISVNTNQGTYGQAEEIVKTIKEYSSKFNCPVYTFAEDIAAGPGYYILASGNKVFIDSFSLIGGITTNTKTLDLIKFSKNYGVKTNIEFAGKHKVRVNPFLELKDEDKAWVQGLLEERVKLVKDYVLDKRGHKIPRDKEKEGLAFSGEVFMGAKAIELGLADSVNDFRSIAKKEYDGLKVVDFKMRIRKDKEFMWAGVTGLGREEIMEIVDEIPGNVLAHRHSFDSFMNH
ncbi:hypothetical protein SteCoe_26326 [Stentor coeruleus]|uniref:Peptidase S49 domain-containing protein n=1 Tax=Stentor coeruleus TaxID=5963 RepID=A0A1R2BDG3_9CILI|nr:hypothetical protein SteCoe_26326 [Stentor coeruleus]